MGSSRSEDGVLGSVGPVNYWTGLGVVMFDSIDGGRCGRFEILWYRCSISLSPAPVYHDFPQPVRTNASSPSDLILRYPIDRACILTLLPPPPGVSIPRCISLSPAPIYHPSRSRFRAPQTTQLHRTTFANNPHPPNYLSEVHMQPIRDYNLSTPMQRR